MYISVHVKGGWICQRMSAQVYMCVCECVCPLFHPVAAKMGGEGHKSLSFYSGC